jgi:uncharacterized lipoprotein YbaY
MKSFLLPAAVLAAAAFLAGGCGHLDIQAEGNPDRVITGTVNFHLDEPLPPDSELSVRLVDTSNGAGAPLPLGEQTIKNPGSPPVAFNFEYHAEDAQLQHGLNLEARVSIGGKLRYYNVSGYAVTLSKADQPQEVWITPVGN